MTNQEALTDYVLRLGDSALILGQRLCEWCGRAPAVEEEMALMNVGLDLIGQARNWMEYAVELQGQGQDADQLAFTRDAHQYRNLLLVEQPNGNYADTCARQYFYDAWHYFTLKALCDSSDARLAEIAAKGLKEVTYHLRRSSEWIKRLGDGTEQSHAKMQAAIDEIWTYTGEAFIADAVDEQMQAAGIGVDLALIQAQWRAHVEATLQEATLTCPDMQAYMQQGSKQGVHTERLGFILAEMQFLQRAYPNSTW